MDKNLFGKTFKLFWRTFSSLFSKRFFTIRWKNVMKGGKKGWKQARKEKKAFFPSGEAARQDEEPNIFPFPV